MARTFTLSFTLTLKFTFTLTHANTHIRAAVEGETGHSGVRATISNS